MPDKYDSTPPGKVSQLTAASLPGGAQIDYALPNDKDLLYVEADYEIRSGVKSQKKASFFNNSMIIEGFGDTTDHVVEIYAVDRSGNRSEAARVSVKPLQPPVRQVYDSLYYDPDFGGINLSYVNENESDIVISIMVKDSVGDWLEYDKAYTNQQKGNYAVRGLPNIPTTFGVYVKDRWGNYSDTLVKTLTPLFEMKLDKTRFEAVPLQGDVKNIWKYSDLWDDDVIWNQGFKSQEGTGFPETISLNLGAKAKLSRFKIWQVIQPGHEANYSYNSGNIQKLELWGSNDPATDGTYDSWTLMGSYEVTKPSGLPPGQVTAEDIEASLAGGEFIVPNSAPSVRYLRIKIVKSFTGAENATTGNAFMAEVSFWGQEEN